MDLSQTVMWEMALVGAIFLVSVFIGFLVFFANKKEKTNIYFLGLALSTAFLILFAYLSEFFPKTAPETSLILSRAALSAASLLMIFFFLFSYVFPVNKKLPNYYLWPCIIIGSILVPIILFTPYVVEGIRLQPWGFDLISGSYYNIIFLPTSIILTLASFLNLILNYRISNKIQKKQLLFIFLGLGLFLISGVFFGAILPAISDSQEYYRIGNYSAIFFVGFTAYAITKHRLFNIKIIATELAVAVVSIALFVQVFMSQTVTESAAQAFVWLIATYGGYLLIKSIIREIERRQEIEKLTHQLEDANKHLKELDQMKTEFISIASHELLTPISAILGYLSMILDEKLVPVDNPKTKKFLDNIYSSAKRLSKLVEDLLNVSRIEQGRIVIDRQAIDAAKAAKEVIAETMPKAKEAKLSLEFDETKETIPKVYADFDKVKEILVNIVGNAIKFTKEGGVTISLSTSRDAEVSGKRGPGNYVIISVKDTGVGIPKEEQANIFKKFSRAGRWATRDVQGTGLGLYVSKSLTELLGGKIWVDSAAGKGSTFSISLPEVRPEDKREISGDVVKLGQPEQKEKVDKGEVKHSTLKPKASPDDTSRKMKNVLTLSPEELRKIKEAKIDKE